MKLEIIPQAQRDIGEAARYYKAQRPGLDDEFLAEVDVRHHSRRPGLGMRRK